MQTNIYFINVYDKFVNYCIFFKKKKKATKLSDLKTFLKWLLVEFIIAKYEVAYM